jgi:hypothetical protein
MRTRLIDLLLVVSLCGLWGCAKSKPVEGAAAEVQPAVDPNPEPTPVVDRKPEQIPARRRAPAAKPEATPANSPKVKASNDVAVQPEAVAHKETKETNAPKEENREVKPAEMKVANAFDRNPYLSSMLKPLLPARTTMTGAAMGFRNQRQFIATLHLSKNLIIPFDQIKTRVTGNHRMSLSDSLRNIRPSLTKNLAKAEVNKAEEQAKDDENQAKDAAKKAAAQDKLATNRKP